MQTNRVTSLSRGQRAGLALTACLGLGVSGYLAAVALVAKGLPIGCGAGDGCAAVLTSRWAGTWGVSVALPAVLLWGMGLVASLIASRRMISFVACSVALAALWFTAVQAVLLGSFCPWCMADHLIGLTFAGLAFAFGCRDRLAVLAGSIGFAILVAGQLIVPYRAGSTGLLGGAGGGSDAIRVGDVTFEANGLPSWGDSSSPTLLVLLADYACPHCRATHGYLKELLITSPGRFRVLVAPVPMDHDCNRTLAATEPRFEHSCELASLALAVWKAKPNEFEAFDAWLFEPEMPRTPEAARAEAQRRVGAGELELALADPSLTVMVDRNIDAFEAVRARRLPVILRAAGASIEGEPASRDELDTLLTDGGADR
ncbi:MAG: thioredoxin domain-containing protein [Phycisphaerae bacterium]|nr:thioredoxin domain-containing protein [Phycisphaerae bacterium]